jgi:hypothetical protein
MPELPAKPQTAMTTIGGQVVLSERLATFKRLCRWLNLTLVHQATWPLLLLLTSAPPGEPEETPLPWYLARLGAPVAATLAALLYLRLRPVEEAPIPPGRHPDDTRSSGRASGRAHALAQQARFLLLGLPLMVAVARLVDGPVEPAAKLALFGLADVAAYHLIHFGVVVRSYQDWAHGMWVATLLFALSWGIHDALLTALGPSAASPALALLGGCVLGLVIALLSRAIRRWPGGALPAAAAHWLVIYLIFGFVG